MLPYDDDDDSDYGSEEYTNVQLGLADGPLEGDDELNPLVSRIGGRPAWLPLPVAKLPPETEVQCAYCGQPMQLLVQIFAPLDDSPYDRNLFVWGCARPRCQRQGDGCIKAMRMLKHNVRWAAKLAKREEKRRMREERARKEREAEDERRRKERETNPFTMKDSGGGGLFGASLFDEGEEMQDEAPREGGMDDDDDDDNDDDDDDDDSLSDDDYNDEERLAEELSIKASLDEQRMQLADHWNHTASHYTTPLYLNTIPEVEPERDEKLDAELEKRTPLVAADEGGEAYEKMAIDGIDPVFERFMRRLGPEARQVVRYEYGGTPLPFTGTGPLYKRLWPNGDFDASSVPPCEQCGARRVFEVQLMPNLANLLRAEHLSDATEADGNAETRRQAEIASILGLKGDNSTPSDLRTGIAWSTAMVFVCSRDCCRDAQEGYAVEHVCLQHESSDMLSAVV